MRPEILYPLFADINTLKGVGERTHKLLANLVNGDKIVNLLWHLPSNIIDRTYSPRLNNVIAGRICTIAVKVVEHIPPKTSKQPYRVIVEDETDQLTLIFFKVYAQSITKALPIGSTRVISGKPESFNGQLQMPHPDYIVRPEEIAKVLGMETVYPLTAGITNKMMGKYMQQVLAKLPNFSEWLDDKFLVQQKWRSFNDAIIKIN